MIKVKEKDKLRFYFGRAPEDRHTYDFIVDWPMMQMGQADASYLLSCVFTKEVREELARRGYDLTTIKFSIAPKLENPTRLEEYREITPYWCKRLLGRETALFSYRNNYQSCNVKGYIHVCFRYGYTRRCFINRIDSITIGRGNPEWGAPTDRDVFIIKHHKEDMIVDGWKIDQMHK